MAPDRLRANFALLDKLLANSRALWEPSPSHYRTGITPPWPRDYSALTTILRKLSVEESTFYRQFPDHWRARLAQQDDLPFWQLAPWQAGSSACMMENPARNSGEKNYPAVPGRKREQIIAFVNSLSKSEGAVVDWCSGKGHLAAEIVRKYQEPVNCLEWDPLLCESGRNLYGDMHPGLTFYPINVLQELPRFLKDTTKVHTALHACGNLHQSMLIQSAAAGAEHIALAPCCYHKTGSGWFRPMSTTAAQSMLMEMPLASTVIRLAMQQTVTAGKREQAVRRKEQSWRMGFEEIVTSIHAGTNSEAAPRVPSALLKHSFKDYCNWAFAHTGTDLPAGIDYRKYLGLGEERWDWVQRLELAREPYRRPLEWWLFYDLALFMQEQGYGVEIREFCSWRLTPRNLLLTAKKSLIA